MAFPAVKTLVSLVLLVSCVSVLGTGPQQPSQAPVKQQQAPTHAPNLAPSHAPVHAPSVAPSHAPVHAPSLAPSHAPVHAPNVAPSHAPVHAPSHAPSPAPTYQKPKRSLVAVQGVVYCKPCELSGVETLINSKPLVGAVMKLQCNNTWYPQTMEAKTDKNGYFFIMAPKTVTTYGAHKCKVTLGSSPQPTCTKPTNLHNGLQGATLVAEQQSNLSKPGPYQVFTVGPFAFEPPTKCAP